MGDFSFSSEQFGALFPYYICIDQYGIITSFGNSIPDTCGIVNGMEFSDAFSYNKENKGRTGLDGVQMNQEAIIQSFNDPTFCFKGRFEQMNSPKQFVFIGNPYLMGAKEKKSDLQSVQFVSLLNKLHSVFKQNGIHKINWQKLSEDLIKSKYIDDVEMINELYGITVSDNVNGQAFWCNVKFEELSGRSFEEVIGKRPRSSIYGKTSVYIDSNYVDTMVKKGIPFYFENIGTSKLGREFWFGAIVQPVYNTDNEIVGRLHIIKDITTRKVKELEIEENENLLKLAVEAAKAGLWAYDILTKDFKVTEEYKKILGFDPSHDITYEEMEARIHPEDAAYLQNEIHPYLNIDNPSFVFEHRINFNGAYRYFNVKANCIKFAADGSPIKIVGTLRDVTDEKEKILEIEKQRKFYHKILDEIPADIVILSPEHKYIYINKKAVINEEIRQWLIGKDDFDYCRMKGIDDRQAKKRRDQFNQATTTKQSVRFIEKKEGSNAVQHMLRVFYPVIEESGNIELIIGYALDITEQVENEKYAQQQERRMKTILDISSDGIFRCKPNGDVIMCNKSFLKILNKDSEKGLNLFDQISDCEKERLIREAENAMATGHTEVGMLTLKEKINGEVKHIEYHLNLTTASNSKTFSGRIADVTAVVMKEKNMQIAIEKQIQLNKYKTQFIHITSHELRTPLTIIQSNSEILQLCYENPALLKKKDPKLLTDRIIKEVELMTDILTQLLMVSKIEEGNMEVNKATVNIKDFINNDVVNIFSPHSDGRQIQVNIRNEITTWYLDPKILRHALINLISNAFKYSYNKQPPELSVTLENNQLIFKITDFGIGIPEEEQQQLFQSFYRASNVGVISGTGIGLMVVDYAVKKHNGTIELNSEINKGSIFTLTIPR